MELSQLIKKWKGVDINIMFTAIHDCYVKYTLNPFSKIRAKIQPPCTEFETSLQSAMDQYNTIKLSVGIESMDFEASEITQIDGNDD